MSRDVQLHGPIGFVPAAGAAVYFSPSAAAAGSGTSSPKSTAVPVKKMETALEVAPWGEDNRFPQNIEKQMAYCNIGKSGLDWKARALYGGGIVPVTITGYDDNGNEVLSTADQVKYKEAYSFIRRRSFFRFMLEYLQDWAWFGNCFPEVIFSNNTQKITDLVHQESCDCRYKQMNEAGKIDTVYLSKLWGMASDQFARFDDKKKIKGLIENPREIDKLDNVYVKMLDCIDMYDAFESAKEIAKKLSDKSGQKSAILPVNYPSVNKTYYQVPAWDGARLSGWAEIASKIPALLKVIYTKAFRIKYHIEIPDTYFEKKFGKEGWEAKTPDEKNQEKMALLEAMDRFLSGAENVYSSFISFFDINPHGKEEYGRVKITPVEDKSSIDKELITSSAADIQLLISMNVHPTLFGAGTIGTGQQRSGGSDIREAFLVYNAMLKLERNVLLEPLYLVRDFNGWGEELEFRFVDTKLTTLDQGKGTQKVLS